jgi:F0F1-type ATP synthase membrane subunit b/b'|tara:strand:+ start:35 stop:343 length:309 start_codon:yes stop_codon:yes gene_type:complete
MKKIWKYIVGFFTIVIGGLLAFLSGRSAGRKDEKFKNINTQIKEIDKNLKKKEKDQNGYKKTLKNKKKALKEIQNSSYKKKKVSVKEASDFLKKYAKKKGKK